MHTNNLLAGLIIMGLFTWLFGCSDKEKPASTDSPNNYEQAEVYRDMRNLVFSLSPERIGLAKDTEEPIAILMETGYPEAVASLVCIADGTTSLYLSSGGGVIGAGEHETVRNVALSFLAMSKQHIDEFQSTNIHPLPQQSFVVFYLITKKGVLTFQAADDDLGNMREILSPLFHKGHEVIAAIRQHSPN